MQFPQRGRLRSDSDDDYINVAGTDRRLASPVQMNITSRPESPTLDGFIVVPEACTRLDVSGLWQ